MKARLVRRVAGPLFGREAELALLEALADGPDRLVVLVGPAGVGKTRLARAALQRLPAGRRQWWVDATVAADARGLVAAVARTLDVLPGTVDPLALLAETAEALERSGGVLVIDELEHLGTAGAAAVASLSDAAPSASVWCTSRERLDAGERVLEVKPLGLDEATALLADHFHRAAPSRRLDGDVAREIAALTEGLPLALELAATRAAAVGPTEVLSDLKHAPGRALTLSHVHDAIARTLKRLPPDLRDAFAAASVFDSGFDAAAARAVLPLAAGYSALDLLQALCDASLLFSYDEGASTRFGILTVIRADAAALLERDAAAAAKARLLHLRHFATLATAGESPEGWAQLQLERGNLSAAWARAATREPASAALLAVALERVLLTQGPAEEHERVLAAALGLGPVAGERPYVELLRAEGRRLALRGHHRAALARFEDALARARVYGEPALVSSTASHASFSARALGQLDHAWQRATEGFELALTLKSPQLTALAETMRGLIAYAREDFAASWAHQRRAVGAASSPRTPRLLGIAWGNLAMAAHASGALDEAFDADVAAIAAFEEAGDRMHIAHISAHYAEMLHRRGRTDEAKQVIAAALPVLRGRAHLEGETELCLTAALIAASARAPQEARRRLDEAEALAARTDDVLLQARVRQALAFAAAPGAEGPTLALTHDAGRLVLPGGHGVDLSRRGTLRRVLLALARRHLEAPGSVLDIDSLLAAGWPGQRMLHESGLARVYMAVRRLRELGLEGVITTRDGGYCLDPATRLAFEKSEDVS